MKKTTIQTIALATLLLPTALTTACDADLDMEPQTGAEVDEAAAPVEQLEADQAQAGMESDQDEQDAESADSGYSAMHARHHGEGGHGYMQDAMHDEMLAEAIERGLITEDDAALFGRVHEAIEPYKPKGSGAGREADAEAKKGMQRAFTELAKADGMVSEADSERFTEIHDLLLDEGIMHGEE